MPNKITLELTPQELFNLYKSIFASGDKPDKTKLQQLKLLIDDFVKNNSNGTTEWEKLTSFLAKESLLPQDRLDAAKNQIEALVYCLKYDPYIKKLSPIPVDTW